MGDVVDTTGGPFSPVDALEEQHWLAAVWMRMAVQMSTDTGLPMEVVTAAMLMAWSRIVVNSDDPELRAKMPGFANATIVHNQIPMWGQHPSDKIFTTMMVADPPKPYKPRKSKGKHDGKEIPDPVP